MRRLSLGLVFLFAMACSDGGTSPMLPPEGSAELRHVSDPSVTLAPGSETTLTVLYIDNSGDVPTPVVGADITWTIEGTAGGASLSTSMSQTDTVGQASVTLTAGSQDASFMVRVTPPVGESIVFRVGVSSTPSGSITARLTYNGSASLGSTTVLAYADTRCDDINPANPPTAVAGSATVSAYTMRPTIMLLPVGTYTVLANAQVSGGSALGATGCIDNVAVTEGNTTMVDIELLDTSDSTIHGIYELENELNLAALLGEDVARFTGIIAELGDDEDIAGNAIRGYGEDPGAFIVDLAFRQTCEWACLGGEDYSSCSSEDHEYGDLQWMYENASRVLVNSDDREGRSAEARFSGGCGLWLGNWDEGSTTNLAYFQQAQQLINEEIENNVSAEITNIIDTITDVADNLTNTKIRSTLQVAEASEVGSPIVHTLDRLEITVRLPSGMTEMFTQDLRAIGLRTGEATADATVRDGVISIPEHTFTIDFGVFLSYLYSDIVLPALGYDTGPEFCDGSGSCHLLASWIDCGAVSTRIVNTLGVDDFLSIEDLTGYCEEGLKAGGRYLDSSLGNLLVSSEGTLYLQGQARGADPDPSSGVATRLANGSWTGRVEGVTDDAQTTNGIFVGRRTGDAR